MTQDDILKTHNTDQMEDAWADFAVNEAPKVPKKYKVTTYSNKQNEPIKKVEER